MGMTKRCDNCAHNRANDHGTHCEHPCCKLSDPIIWEHGNSTPRIYAVWCRGEKFMEVANV